MGLRETEGSLRAYMLIGGMTSVLLGGGDILLGGPGTGIAAWLPAILMVVEGAAFIWAGVRLRSALLTGTRRIEHVLIASGALIFIEGAVVTAAGGSQSTFHDVFGLAWDLTLIAISLAITIYLYRSTLRLSAERRAREGLPAAPPLATVI